MLDIWLMKVFIVLGIAAFLAIWIKYIRLSRIRKSSTEMPAPFKLLALTTGGLDRGSILISLGFASFFVLRGHLNMFLPFSGYLDFPLQLTGMALLVIGMFGAWWAIASLGEFNQPRWAHLKQGHAIVKTGAYRYIRHPQYASKMIVYFGLFLFLKDFLFLLLFLSSVLLMYSQAKSEEKLLIRVFGEEYKGYQAASGMFFPPLFRQWIRLVPKATLQKGTKASETLSRLKGGVNISSSDDKVSR